MHDLGVGGSRVQEEIWVYRYQLPDQSDVGERVDRAVCFVPVSLGVIVNTKRLQRSSIRNQLCSVKYARVDGDER